MSTEEKINLHTKGAKDDSAKPRLDLVLGDFSDALWEVGKVGTFGASKYCDRGWHEVENGRERYASALLRHYFRFKKGEVLDNESKLLHLSHMAWNALAILQLEIEDIQFNEILKGNLPTIEEVQSDHPDFKSINKLQEGYNKFMCKYKYDCDYKEG